MTDQQLIDYYAGLLILQYIGKPKAYATIQASVKPVIMNQLPLLVQAAFAVNTAIGKQLDVLGKYVGISRNALTFSGPVVLDDTEYRVLVKLKIIQNNSGSSLADIQTLIAGFFPGALVVFDNKNMSMSYYFDSAYGSMQLAEIFVRQGLLPRPMGVQLAALIYTANLDNIFGFRTYDLPGYNVSGFNDYSDYQTGRPWLSYQDAIGP